MNSKIPAAVRAIRFLSVLKKSILQTSKKMSKAKALNFLYK